MGQTHDAKRLAYFKARTDARGKVDPVRKKRDARAYNRKAKAEGGLTLTDLYKLRKDEERHALNNAPDLEQATRDLGMDLSGVRAGE